MNKKRTQKRAHSFTYTKKPWKATRSYSFNDKENVQTQKKAYNLQIAKEIKQEAEKELPKLQLITDPLGNMRFRKDLSSHCQKTSEHGFRKYLPSWLTINTGFLDRFMEGNILLNEKEKENKDFGNNNKKQSSEYENSEVDSDEKSAFAQNDDEPGQKISPKKPQGSKTCGKAHTTDRTKLLEKTIRTTCIQDYIDIPDLLFRANISRADQISIVKSIIKQKPAKLSGDAKNTETVPKDTLDDFESSTSKSDSNRNINSDPVFDQSIKDQLNSILGIKKPEDLPQISKQMFGKFLKDKATSNSFNKYLDEYFISKNIEEKEKEAYIELLLKLFTSKIAAGSENDNFQIARRKSVDCSNVYGKSYNKMQKNYDSLDFWQLCYEQIVRTQIGMASNQKDLAIKKIIIPKFLKNKNIEAQKDSRRNMSQSISLTNLDSDRKLNKNIFGHGSLNQEVNRSVSQTSWKSGSEESKNSKIIKAEVHGLDENTPSKFSINLLNSAQKNDEDLIDTPKNKRKVSFNIQNSQYRIDTNNVRINTPKEKASLVKKIQKKNPNDIKMERIKEIQQKYIDIPKKTDADVRSKTSGSFDLKNKNYKKSFTDSKGFQMNAISDTESKNLDTMHYRNCRMVKKEIEDSYDTSMIKHTDANSTNYLVGLKEKLLSDNNEIKKINKIFHQKFLSVSELEKDTFLKKTRSNKDSEEITKKKSELSSKNYDNIHAANLRSYKSLSNISKEIKLTFICNHDKFETETNQFNTPKNHIQKFYMKKNNSTKNLIQKNPTYQNTNSSMQKNPYATAANEEQKKFEAVNSSRLNSYFNDLQQRNQPEINKLKSCRESLGTSSNFGTKNSFYDSKKNMKENSDTKNKPKSYSQQIKKNCFYKTKNMHLLKNLDSVKETKKYSSIDKNDVTESQNFTKKPMATFFTNREKMSQSCKFPLEGENLTLDAYKKKIKIEKRIYDKSLSPKTSKIPSKFSPRNLNTKYDKNSTDGLNKTDDNFINKTEEKKVNLEHEIIQNRTADNFNKRNKKIKQNFEKHSKIAIKNLEDTIYGKIPTKNIDHQNAVTKLRSIQTSFNEITDLSDKNSYIQNLMPSKSFQTNFLQNKRCYKISRVSRSKGNSDMTHLNHFQSDQNAKNNKELEIIKIENQKPGKSSRKIAKNPYDDRALKINKKTAAELVDLLEEQHIEEKNKKQKDIDYGNYVYKNQKGYGHRYMI